MATVFTIARPRPLGLMSFAELVCEEREAREARDTADRIMQLAGGGDHPAEEARYCEADDRIEAIEREIRGRLESHVGGRAVLDQILRII